MTKVLGLGGVFFKVEDQEAWRAWYSRVLGLKFEDFGSCLFPHPDVGFTNVTPFASDTTYFAPSAAPFMINLIVGDMDEVLTGAKAAGVEPLGRQEESYGRFARFLDPAGIKVELWQPLGPSPV